MIFGDNSSDGVAHSKKGNLPPNVSACRKSSLPIPGNEDINIRDCQLRIPIDKLYRFTRVLFQIISLCTVTMLCIP